MIFGPIRRADIGCGVCGVLQGINDLRDACGGQKNALQIVQSRIVNYRFIFSLSIKYLCQTRVNLCAHQPESILFQEKGQHGAIVFAVRVNIIRDKSAIRRHSRRAPFTGRLRITTQALFRLEGEK